MRKNDVIFQTTKNMRVLGTGAVEGKPVCWALWGGGSKIRGFHGVVHQHTLSQHHPCSSQEATV